MMTTRKQLKEVCRLLFRLKGVLLTTSELLQLKDEPWHGVRTMSWSPDDVDLMGQLYLMMGYIKNCQVVLARAVRDGKGGNKAIQLMEDANGFLADWSNNRQLRR